MRLTGDSTPCWYEFTRKRGVGMLLRIHEDFISQNNNIVGRHSPIVQSLMNDFEFSDFAPNFTGDFGFESMLKYRGIRNGFAEYKVPICVCRKTTNKPCSFCDGTGKREIYDDRCSSCGGKKKEVVYDYREAYAVSASLNVLFLLLGMTPEKPTSAPYPQLTTIQIMTLQSLHGGSLSGELSKNVVDFLKKRGLGEVSEIVSTMKSIWRKMDARMPKFYKYEFQACVQGNNGWLSISCPGNACDLNPNHSSFDSTAKGYGFSSHNTDTMIQQMTLLGAVAELHHLVRPPK